MSGRGRNRNHNQASVSSKDAASLAGDSPILAVFLNAARKLTARQDRHERLVKISRDITVESKRIIFLLHEAVIIEKSQKQIIDEANKRLHQLVNGPIRAIALELQNVPAHLHSKAIAAGLQEFIEARTLCSLMEHRLIITHSEVQNEFTYSLMSENGTGQTITAPLPPQDYMLGLADLSGEMMKKAINSIASGESDECFFACDVVRQLHAGFLGISGPGSVNAKLTATRANVHKVESAVYALRMRESEALAQSLASARND